eukprot:TRINITY_DN641_c0_g1_i1.p1 TRINITY_DN641_c0_g1~~TRINITY_DN641_c0_g1_i1.p1  ORF type:complete len:190 (+),score=13.22 TRINITY_DN641_c0_g1_i1:214-783(+)
MPILVINEENKKDLSILSELNEDQIRECCSAALEFLEKGEYKKFYSNLGVPSAAVSALASLFLETARVLGTAADLEGVGGGSAIIGEFYTSNRARLRAILGGAGAGGVWYRDIGWRLQVTRGSRLQRAPAHAEPAFLVRLDTVAGEDESATPTYLESTWDALSHVHAELEQALGAARGGHARRIARNLR